MALPAKRRRSTRTEEHTWPLGAFAELVATACAASTHLHIHAHPSPPHITFLDNGPGHPSATLSALTAPSPWRTAATTIGSSLALLTILSDGTATAALLTDPPHILHWPSISPHHPDLPKFLQATPWSSYQQVNAAFQAIPTSGSLLVISNLKSNPANPTATHLDFSDPHDIRYPSTSNIRLSTSLRAYLQLLFLRPKARIYLRGRIVRERKLASMMWARTDFLYTPRVVHDTVATMRFGFDPHAAADEYGMLIYCRGRLIRPFMRVGPQIPGADVKVVGIIEADFLSPTRNMQAFKRDKLYQGLIFSIDRSLKAFWVKYGNMNKVFQLHSRDIVPKWSRCDDCGHWRIVAARDGALNPEDISCTRWVCAMNVGGTIKCGAPDDADTAVVVGNRRILCAGKSKAEFSAAMKQMRSDSPIDATKLATDSQPSSGEATRRRPRALQQSASNWVVNGVAGDSLRSSPATTAGVSAPNINVAEMNTTGESLIREPNLDLDQPTPELVSPELHFNGDGFTLSRNGVAGPPAVPPVSVSASLPTTSAGLFPSSAASPRVAYGPIEAFLRNVEVKEASLHGGVSLLNKNPNTEGKGVEGISTTLNSEAEQKISLVSSSYGLGDTLILGRPDQAVGGGDTLKSSSSVTHEAVPNADIVHDSVIDIMGTTNGTNCQIFGSRPPLEPQSIPNERSEAVIPASSINPQQILKDHANTQVAPSSGLMPPPPLRRENIEVTTFDPARSKSGEVVNTTNPNRLPEKSYGGRRESFCNVQGKENVAADGSKSNHLGSNNGNHCDGSLAHDPSPSTVHQGVQQPQLLSSPAEGVVRCDEAGFAKISKENGHSECGKAPMGSCQDPPEFNGGVTTSSAFQISASNHEKGCGPKDGNPVNDPDFRSSRQMGLNRESIVEKRGTSCMTEVNSKEGKKYAGTEQKSAALQDSPLDEVEMTQLLDLDDDGEIGASNLHGRADAPTQGIPPGINVESGNNQLPAGRTLNARSGDKAALFGRDSEHGKLSSRPQSPACQPMDVGSDGTEPFEKETPNQMEDVAKQRGGDEDVHGVINNRSRYNSTPRTQKDLAESENLGMSRRDSSEMESEGKGRSLTIKRRHEEGASQGENDVEEYRRVGKRHKNAHLNTHTMRGNDSQREGADPDKRRRLGDNSLAVAAEAATSAAHAALGDLEMEDTIPTRRGALTSSATMELTWSQLALSAAVAAGAAAAAATTMRQSQQEGRATTGRNSNCAEGKLRNLISRLVPTADEAKLDDMEALDVERVAEEIKTQIKRDAKEDVVRNVSRQQEEGQAELKSEKEELRKLRNLVHIFLDKVVGILQTEDAHDDAHEQVGNQLEYYLRLLDALPPNGPS